MGALNSFTKTNTPGEDSHWVVASGKGVQRGVGLEGKSVVRKLDEGPTRNSLGFSFAKPTKIHHPRTPPTSLLKKPMPPASKLLGSFFPSIVLLVRGRVGALNSFLLTCHGGHEGVGSHLLTLFHKRDTEKSPGQLQKLNQSTTYESRRTGPNGSYLPSTF